MSIETNLKSYLPNFIITVDDLNYILLFTKEIQKMSAASINDVRKICIFNLHQRPQTFKTEKFTKT